MLPGETYAQLFARHAGQFRLNVALMNQDEGRSSSSSATGGPRSILNGIVTVSKNLAVRVRRVLLLSRTDEPEQHFQLEMLAALRWIASHTGRKIHDTHAYHSGTHSESTRPDVVLAPPHVETARSPADWGVVVELKKNDDIGSPENMGQLLSYAFRIFAADARREFVIGCLVCPMSLIVCRYERNGQFMASVPYRSPAVNSSMAENLCRVFLAPNALLGIHDVPDFEIPPEQVPVVRIPPTLEEARVAYIRARAAYVAAHEEYVELLKSLGELRL